MPPGRRSEDWVNSISRTLQWNSRQRQKEFTDWSDDKAEQTEQARKDYEQRLDQKRGGAGHPGLQ